jgi:hypothetical protein
MVHVLYGGDITAGEATTEHDIIPLRPFRVKTKGGRYFHLLASGANEIEAWLNTPESSPALDRMSVLEGELADLKARIPESK